MVEGSCHCGAVRVQIPAVPQTATMCNCSICRRYGGLTAYYPQALVRFVGHPEHTQTYAWGDRTLQFVRCRHCGCMTHWEPLAPEAEGRVGVNLRNFEPQLMQGVTLRRFDGASSWRYVDRA